MIFEGLWGRGLEEYHMLEWAVGAWWRVHSGVEERILEWKQVKVRAMRGRGLMGWRLISVASLCDYEPGGQIRCRWPSVHRSTMTARCGSLLSCLTISSTWSIYSSPTKQAGLIRDKSALLASVLHRSFSRSRRDPLLLPQILHSNIPGGSRKRDNRRSVSTLADVSTTNLV